MRDIAKARDDTSTARLWTVAIVGALATLMIAAPPARGWYARGHERATALALEAVEDELPRFFDRGRRTIVHLSIDPDMFRNPATPQLRDATGSDHYFDLELLQGRPLPATRHGLIEMAEDLGVEPSKIGYAPYAIVEMTQRLTLALAEHRRRPDDEAIHAKTLVYAGLLAHYAQDLCQPLHTTVHFDGRVDARGRSPRTGIHRRMDNLLGMVEIRDREVDDAIAERLEEPSRDGLLERVVDELKRSHRLVDRVYELEAELPTSDEQQQDFEPSEAVAELARDRLIACSSFTARLYLTAWQASAHVKLQPWEIQARRRQHDAR